MDTENEDYKPVWSRRKSELFDYIMENSVLSSMRDMSGRYELRFNGRRNIHSATEGPNESDQIFECKNEVIEKLRVSLEYKQYLQLKEKFKDFETQQDCDDE